MDRTPPPRLASRLTTRDGLALHVQEWPVPQARGTVLIVHGLGEHIGRYAQVAQHLNAQGWRVVGHDHRGHGRSEGARGAIARADDYLVDLALLVDAVRATHPGPLMLLGHSLGGLIAARFALGTMETPAPAWRREIDALVLSSPALDPGMNGAQRALLAVLGPLAPNLAVGNGLRPAWISRDPAVVQAYVADPLVHDRVTPRVVRFIVDEGIAVRSAAARWHMPTLLMWAGSDRCVAPAGSAAFAAAAPAEFVRTHEFSPLFHEIFNEPERAQVLALLSQWLDGRVAPAQG